MKLRRVLFPRGRNLVQCDSCKKWSKPVFGRTIVYTVIFGLAAAFAVDLLNLKPYLQSNLSAAFVILVLIGAFTGIAKRTLTLKKHH